ncbi:MAG: hypothetical protein HQL14_01330 [Candidatus Omnitrophica bacterium]|nr:hypothetical protein [Candidatus Omnitrophota bacterium]
MLKKIHTLYIVNFLSAFLLFQIELITAKIFLPKFGGSYLVWGGCVVFFQCVLLLSYLYSHLVAQIFGIFRYRYFHLILILLPLIVFPGRNLPPIFAHNNIPLVADIFIQLISSVGLVFFVLSTISVISQSWLASSELRERDNPYILYAVSNAGSFLGLLTYPFIFEAHFGLQEQLLIWRFCYIVFILFYLLAFKSIACSDKALPKFYFSFTGLFVNQIAHSDFFGIKLMWVLLSAAGCMAFLSVTNIITYQIAPCPLLWMIPLCIYLISFVLTFRERPLCPSWIKDKFYLVFGFGVLVYFFTIKGFFPPLLTIAANLICLFAICMHCQYQLYMSRPKDNSGLTVFYLLIAFGGFAGSFFVTWIAPVVFPSTYEYLFGLWIVSAVYLFQGERGKISFYHMRQVVYLLLLIFLWPLVFKRYNFFGILFLFFAVKFIFTNLKTNLRSISLCLAAVFCLAFFVDNSWKTQAINFFIQRNYYGIYRVYANKEFFELDSGITIHGMQYISKEKQNVPLAYFHENTPLGKVLGSGNFNFDHVGVIGLGVGTIAAYGKDQEVIDFFEIDKDVYWIAKNLFTYIDHSKAKTNIVIGDARNSLKGVPDQTYDLLIVDAFSGDYVPVHLLTTDAMLEYRRCLKKNGFILFHISNQLIDLAPILSKNASYIGAYSLMNQNKEEKDGCLRSLWGAITWDKDVRGMLISKLAWIEMRPDSFQNKKIRPWTDDYTYLLSVIRMDLLILSTKYFTPFYWDWDFFRS